ITSSMVNGLITYPYSAVASKITGYTFYDFDGWTGDWQVWDSWPHKTSSSPSPPPSPPPSSPSPPSSSGYTRENYMLQSETFDGSNFNMTISTGQAGGPSFISNWNKITGGASHTGGATKFCNVPNGQFTASAYFKKDTVNFALMKVQP